MTDMTLPIKKNDAFFDVKINSDVNIPLEYLSKYVPDLISVMTFEDLTNIFNNEEKIAKFNKKAYHTAGLTGLVFLIIYLLLLVFKLLATTLPTYIILPKWFDIALVVSGLTPVICLILLHFGNFKKKWLESRYRAERLRQWLYQELLDGNYIENSVDNSLDFQMEREEKWNIFQAELSENDSNKGMSLEKLLKYSGNQIFFTLKQYTKNELWLQVSKFYKKTRIIYQLNHFIGQQPKYESLDVWTSGMANVLLLVGILLAFIKAVFLIFHIADYIGFITIALALCFTLLSMGIRIYRSATGISEHNERYKSKINDFVKLQERFESLEKVYNEQDQQVCMNKTEQERKENILSTIRTQQLNCMEKVEEECVKEMIEFLRTSKKSDFFI